VDSNPPSEVVAGGYRRRRGGGLHVNPPVEVVHGAGDQWEPTVRHPPFISAPRFDGCVRPRPSGLPVRHRAAWGIGAVAVPGLLDFREEDQ
jgi:hypothetical protein